MSDIENLRSRLDILELAGDYVRDLKRSGRSWSGLCPFHEEKTPSFHINPEKGLFHCFGCNAGGDAIAFYMQIEKLGFREAIEGLCDKLGLPRPQGWASEAPGTDAKARAQMQKALVVASDLFVEALWVREDPMAEEARNYLFDKRRMDRKIIQNYRVGLAPKNSSWLLTKLVTKYGFEPRLLEKAGLVSASHRDGRTMDFFRGRLMFPVWDHHGRITGFGGRVLRETEGGPKYLNSADNQFFKKGEMLYGLYQHREEIRSKGKAYVVEGYFDVIGLAQAGITSSASPMGGALTAGHARMLKRFTEKVVMLFDPDAAGISSAIRAARLLVSHGIQVHALKLPSKMDPDEYLLAYGKAAFEVLESKEAKGFIEFELEHRMLSASAGSDLSSRLAIAHAMLPSLTVITSEVERRESLIQVAQVLRLDPLGLERELFKQFSGASYGVPSRRAAREPGLGAGAFRPEWELTVEESLLALALQDFSQVRQALTQQGIVCEDFQNSKIGQYLFSGGADGAETTQVVYDMEWQAILSRVTLSQEQAGDAAGFEERLAEYARQLKRRKLFQELKGLREKVAQSRQSGKPCEPAVLERYFEVSRVLKGKQEV